MDGIGLVAATIALTVSGQLLIKRGMDMAGQLPPSLFGAVLRLGRIILTNGLVVLGLVAAFFGLLSWMGALTKLPLTEAYPFIAVTYVLVMFAAHVLFREKIGRWQWIGISLIVIGVVLAGMG